MSGLREFQHLFEGRLDVVGTDWGECKRIEGDPWKGLFFGHLMNGGVDAIGTYPLYSDGTVAWGCVDIDEDTLQHAVNLQTVLGVFNVDAWIERSRSKGYHVWVLLPGDVDIPATLMRKALQAACQIVGCPDKEVNPKQTELAPGQVGNYVRLPYPAGSMPRQVMIEPSGGMIGFADFIDRAVEGRRQEPGLTSLASQWIDPHPPVARPVDPPVCVSSDPVRRMSSLAFVLWRDGPKYPDRSAAIWRLITELVQQGAHTYHEIVDLVADADQRWGKYQQRPNGLAEIERQVQKAWGS